MSFARRLLVWAIYIVYKYQVTVALCRIKGRMEEVRLQMLP
jgi:hypothetical protein